MGIEGNSRTKRYTRRERIPSEKGKEAEKEAQEKRKRKAQRNVKLLSTKCKVCSDLPRHQWRNQETDTTCDRCKEELHTECVYVVIADKAYCNECVKVAPWGTPEKGSVEVPMKARLVRSAAQIEQNRLQAVYLREAKQKERQSSLPLTPKQMEKQLNRQNDELLKQLKELEIQCMPLQPHQYPIQSSDQSMNQSSDHEHTSNEESILIEGQDPTLTGSQIQLINELEIQTAEQTNIPLADDKMTHPRNSSVSPKNITRSRGNRRKLVSPPNSTSPTIKEGTRCARNDNSAVIKSPTPELEEMNGIHSQPVHVMVHRVKDHHTVTRSPEKVEEYDGGKTASGDNEETKCPNSELSNSAPELEIANERSNRETKAESDGDWYSCNDTSDEESNSTDNSFSSSSDTDMSSEEEMELTEQESEPREDSEVNQRFDDYISGVEKTAIEDYSETHTHSIYYTKNSSDADEKPTYDCKLCHQKSTSVGGIKNHLNRTHKIGKTKKPKDLCRKCMRRVLDSEAAGTCIVCKGKEHYRCTRTSKANELEYKNGSAPFKCSQCCAPGLLEVLTENIEENSEATAEQTLNDVIQQNEILNQKIQQYVEREEVIKCEAQGIAE